MDGSDNLSSHSPDNHHNSERIISIITGITVYLPLRNVHGDASVPDVVELRLEAIVVDEVRSSGGARQFEQGVAAPTSQSSREQFERLVLVVFVVRMSSLNDLSWSCS